MICYPVLTKNVLKIPKPKPTHKARKVPLADLGFLAVAAAAVPAAGSLLGDAGPVPAGMGAVHTTAPSSGMRTFLAACAWAFMLAAGSMVYQHFLAKWEGSGLPILPIAALGTMGTNPITSQQQHHPQAQPGAPYQQTPINRGYAIPGAQQQPGQYPSQGNVEGSILDRYDC